MNEQDEIFAAGHQAIRAGLVALGQAGQTIAQHSAERQRRQNAIVQLQRAQWLLGGSRGPPRAWTWASWHKCATCGDGGGS